MSQIDTMIDELCPDGVTYVQLGEVAEYSRTRIQASSVDSTSFIGVDNLKADRGGKSNSDYVPVTGNLTEYRCGDVLIGNIRPYLKKIWLATHNGGCSGDVLSVRIREESKHALMAGFLYQVLASDMFFAYNMQHAKGAKMPRGSKEMIMRYRIPVPPLAIQREIVRILDTFSALEAELEAELEARRQQYMHYRNALLTFDERRTTNDERRINYTTGQIG